MRKLLVCGLTLAAVLTATTASAGDPIGFTLTNETDATLVSLFISVPSTNEWEEDIFGDRVLPPGGTANVRIADGLDDCEYDVKATFSDGDELALGSVDFCELDGAALSVG